MQQQEELSWIGYVLRDVVTFLARNDMMQSAQMLAAAVAHIEDEMKKQGPAPRDTVTPDVNVVKFPSRKRRLH